MLVAVASVKGSPGVTTFAVALAACWPATRRVVVEADASGGDLAVRFGLRMAPGLVSLAADVRSDGGLDPTLVDRHAHRIGDGVLVVPAPPGAPDAARALAAMTPGGLAALQVCAADPETVVIVDCGRLGPDSAAVSAADGADVLLVLSGAHADELAHLPSRLPTVGRGCRQRRLLLVGDGYAIGDVERELGVGIADRIPRDAPAAAALRGAGTAGRRTRLARAAERCAYSLLTDRSSGAQTPRAAPPLAGHPVQWSAAPVTWVSLAGEAAVAGNAGHDERSES